ncbi:MAG: hypothetical protein WA082_04340 [Candidatus Moraniibacteriota bacterium]
MKKEYPWKMKWTKRTMAALQFVTENASVVDLGGGLGEVHDLRPDLYYLSIDREKWNEYTVVADMEKELPDIGHKRDFVLSLGAIEYMGDPERFLSEIEKYGKSLVISYRYGPINMGRKNQMTIGEFIKMLKRSNWEIISEIKISTIERIWYCRKTL